MNLEATCQRLYDTYVVRGNHGDSDYFRLIKELLKYKDQQDPVVDQYRSRVYQHIEDEIISNSDMPRSEISFGTSGWRGVLGKDIFVGSVKSVTNGIVELYYSLGSSPELAQHLGVSSLEEARRRGCLVGFDNRFGGDILAQAVCDVLVEHGFQVYFCGETTTGVLSAALLELDAAFSVNLTPSHNPLEYGGYKFNAADAGPAASELTTLITKYSRQIVSEGVLRAPDADLRRGELQSVDSFSLWQKMVNSNEEYHGIDYSQLIEKASAAEHLKIVVDSVHGASRLHIERLFGKAFVSVTMLRGGADVSFGGIAPEPSSVNMVGVGEELRRSDSQLRVGAIIDPDGDRIRFTDGETEISMNQFGAMAYYFLHEYKDKKGMVAKTVATSNFANAIAKALGEQVFEPRVGFKEFKPVIGKALVLFEESDGISIIGHTPEKDAYVGLLLALDMVLTTNKNLGDFKRELEDKFGAYYPDRDGIEVVLSGAHLLDALRVLEKYKAGRTVLVGDQEKVIKEVISIDGRKMIFEDDSWLMIRPSGTEPKVRFYVESRDHAGTDHLVVAARNMLVEVGLIEGDTPAA